MGQIFISYRREETAGHAGRLEERLESHFGAEQVFRDIEDLTPGLPFPDAIDRRLDQASVILVLIGARWLVAEHDGVRRLDREDDYVRIEVARALHSGKPVVPVLIDDVPMPEPAQLPEPLAGLARRHAVRLTDAGWHDDVARLEKTLETWVAPASRRRRGGRRVWLAAGFVLVCLLAIGQYWFRVTPPFPDGAWQGSVHYDWGETYTERFVFERQGDSIAGTASFLERPRAIRDAHWSDGVLSFETRSESQMGSETRELSHRYRLVSAGEDRWRVNYAIEGGFGAVTPMVFELTRSPP
jgi:hypothetical protein